jgi:hydrogenase-4 transcriptional activator
MNKLNSLLLDVWREACRHIAIAEAGDRIATLIARHLPLAGMRILRLDKAASSLITVLETGGLAASAPEIPHSAAPSPTQAPSAIHPVSQRIDAASERRLLDWCRAGKVYHSHQRQAGILKLLLSQRATTDVLAAPLLGKNDEGEPGTAGVVILLAREGQEFTTAHGEILLSLLEPLAVALENDARVHELASLRDAAEADRGALLRRLGKQEMLDAIVGESGGLQPVMERVDLVAASDAPVLILGETGTGKEVIARAIHTRSPHRHGPFIRVNCGAIPHELIDSQLFGHEKGSFTGAEQTRLGWFERAHGGTLFLDEIGELPLPAQVRFLRVLQDGFVERVGGQHPLHVEVRIVAATHRDLAAMVRQHTFREDLWYRLNVFPILLPPLRDRMDDIPALATHFAQRAAMRFGLPAAPLTEEDLQRLQQYDWPGNIRELGAVIDRAVILGNGQRLEIATALGPAGQTGGPGLAYRSASAASSRRWQTPETAPATPPELTLDEAMKQHIERVLARTRGKIEGPAGAAEILGINPHTLRGRMRKLGIPWSQFRSPPDA